jgi:hypothetical protein
MECRRAAKPSDQAEIFGAPIRGSEKRGRAFLQTAAPMKATGGVTPVAEFYQKSMVALFL